MPHDELSKYVGNHGGAYTDIDGMSKQFTYVDHDKKTKVSTQSGEPEDGWDVSYREKLLERIFSMPASICPELFSDFTIRGEAKKTIEWDRNMLSDSGMPSSRLRELAVLLENRAESIKFIP